MSNRNWFPTYTGKKINILKMKISDIDIRDMAHHLSLECRFGGATPKMDSVAQHSVLVSMHIERFGGSTEESLWGLLHDGAETYLCDMGKGIKYLFPKFVRLENFILRLISIKYNLTWPMPKVVKHWDYIIGCNEAFTFIKGGSPEFFEVDPVPKVYMTLWDSDYAEKMFLARFEILKTRQSTESLESTETS